ncbi:MAG TPA: hypothetical protein VKU38_12290, partial [Ktedonobacteraceae bacterium]|nr:hypothetical protein [Ktedonobacteraceae bacterium]
MEQFSNQVEGELSYGILRTSCFTGDWEKTMAKKRFKKPFSRLRGKLTLSYTLTSVVTFLFIELIFIAIVLWFVSFNLPGILLGDLQKETPQVATYFVHGTPDPQELTDGLSVINTALPSQGPPGQSNTLIFLTVVNTQGQVLASVGSHAVQANTSMQTQLSPQSWANLQDVLRDSRGTTSEVNVEADGTLVAEAPIVGNTGNLQGVLILKTAKPDIFQLLTDFLQLIIITCIAVTLIAAISGTVFGYLAARGITR